MKVGMARTQIVYQCLPVVSTHSSPTPVPLLRRAYVVGLLDALTSQMSLTARFCRITRCVDPVVVEERPAEFVLDGALQGVCLTRMNGTFLQKWPAGTVDVVGC